MGGGLNKSYGWCPGMHDTSPCFDLSFFKVYSCLLCTKSLSPPIRVRIQGNMAASLPTYLVAEALPACLFPALKLHLMSTGHQIDVGSPQRFFQSFLPLSLLSGVCLCTDISSITASTASLCLNVDFCLASLLLYPLLFHPPTNSCHRFNSHFKQTFQNKELCKVVFCSG